MLTEQQVKDRRLGIGGSDLPIILGLSNYKTPYELYLEKTGQVQPEFEMTPRQYWGHKLEGVIREEFELRNQVKVETPDTKIHPFYDFMRANVDGFIPERNRVFEAKCSDAFMAYEWGDDGSDVIPLAYLAQVSHYVSTWNADGSDIAVLIGGNDYREFVYTRDLGLEGKIINAAKDFWNCVTSGTPPDPANESDLKLMYAPSKPEKQIIINDKIITCVEGLSETKRKVKELTEIENQYKFEIMEYMKDSECLVDGDGKNIATWKTNKKGSRTFLLKA